MKINLFHIRTTALTASNYKDYLKYPGFNADYSSNIHIVTVFGE